MPACALGLVVAAIAISQHLGLISFAPVAKMFLGAVGAVTTFVGNMQLPAVVTGISLGMGFGVAAALVASCIAIAAIGFAVKTHLARKAQPVEGEKAPAQQASSASSSILMAQTLAKEGSGVASPMPLLATPTPSAVVRNGASRQLSGAVSTTPEISRVPSARPAM